MARPPRTTALQAKPAPVDWPLGRRLRYVGGTAVLCAIGAVAVELVFADVPGRRSRNLYDSTGWSPLAPTLRGASLGIILAGITGAIALPLFRRHCGGALVGLLAYVAFCVGLVLGSAWDDWRTLFPTGTFERWQGMVLFVGFGAMFALLGMQMRPLALGKPADTASDDGPWIF